MLDRERSLLMRNVPEAAFLTLRQRENQVLVDWIKQVAGCEPTPASDSEASIKGGTKMCAKCKTVRPTDHFEMHTRQSEVNLCKPCARLRVPSIDVSLYRMMLQAIRRNERKRGALSSCAFIVQQEDIREIVETIWHGHSVLSQCDNRKQLR